MRLRKSAYIIRMVPSCNWRSWDCLYSGVGAVIFGEARGPEDAFYTPLGFIIFLSLVVGIGKLIVGGANLFYNEKRHLELLEAERVEAERERERAVAVLEWYERHKDQLPDVPPPGMERNGH